MHLLGMLVRSNMPTPETRVEEIADKVWRSGNSFRTYKERKQEILELLTTLDTAAYERGRRESEARLNQYLQHDITCRTQFESLECDCGLVEALTPDDKIN